MFNHMLVLPENQSGELSLCRDVDPKLDDAMVAYRRYFGPDHLIVEEVTPSDFRKVGGTLLPFTIVWSIFDSKHTETARWEATVLAYHVNAPDNTPESDHIDRPAGTTVSDNVRHVRVKHPL